MKIILMYLLIAAGLDLALLIVSLIWTPLVALAVLGCLVAGAGLCILSLFLKGNA